MKSNQLSYRIGNIDDRLIEQAENIHNYRRGRRNRTVLVSIAAVLVLSVVTVFALTNSFSRLIERLSPPFQEVLAPVEMASVDQGIKMEVVAAGFFDNMGMAYITLQDLGGNRIDENTDIARDLFVYNEGEYCPSQLDFVDFDKENGTVTYLCTFYTSYILEDSADTFENGVLTFRNSKIFYNSRGFNDYPTGVDLTAIANTAESIIVPFTYFNADLPSSMTAMPDTVTILKKGGHAYSMPDNPTSRIVAAGLIDNKLHVQAWSDVAAEGAFTAYYLSDGTDNWIWPEEIYYFNYDEQGCFAEEKLSSHLCNMQEMIFQEALNLADLQLLASFGLQDVLYGEWSVTVVNNQIFEPLKQGCYIETDDYTYESVSINPFGLTMTGTRLNKYAKSDPPGAIVHTEDGDIILELKSAIYPPDGSTEVMYGSPKPIDMGKVKSVTIAGDVILFGGAGGTVL